MEIAPNYGHSVEFLRRWRTAGPWHLTAVEPDSRRISSATFDASTIDALDAWLTAHGASRNIYFTVNSLIPGASPNKKAARSDVLSLDWLHVDVDPWDGESLEDAQERGLRTLRDEQPGGLPAPTVIVFSGGGYQGFWKLSDPLPINGDPSVYEDAARYNIQVEVLYRADRCHNVDRIMRLPGTLNRPDARKRKKGRSLALAELVEWHDDRVYPLSTFKQAPLVQSAGKGFDAPTPIDVSGNVRRISSVDELPASVPAAVKEAIVSGVVEEFGGDRSKCLWWVCCELVRADVSDEVIYSVITDPEWGISASVLDKRSGAERYAQRQVRRAREHAIDPLLVEMNDRHAVIGDYGGKCVVITEVEDAHGSGIRPRISRQSFEDIRNRYLHRTVEWGNGNGGKGSMQLGHWWLRHPKRRQFDRVVFEPGRDVPNAYNLWHGFACEAIPGDCSLYLDHVRDQICSGDEKIYQYVLGWMARAIQYPAQPGHVAVVLKGEQGTGKGKFATVFGSLFGRHFLHISKTEHLIGKFNAHLRDCVLLFADEAFFAGDKGHVGALKALISEELSAHEAKYMNMEQGLNCVHLIMASNENWIIPAGANERRFLVLDVSREHMQDSGYFKAIDDQMNAGGREALLHMLMTMDLSTFEVRDRPKTAALQEQQKLSLAADEEWWYQKLVAGEIFEGQGWTDFVFVTSLGMDLAHYHRTWQTMGRGNATRLGMLLTRVLPKDCVQKVRVSGYHDIPTPEGRVVKVDRPMAYVMPSLHVCRQHWDQNFGGPYKWGDDEEVNPDTPF